MNWVDVLDNQQAVTSLFRDIAALSSITLHEVWLNREGPVLRLRFDVPVVPPVLPKKWPKGANTTQFTIAAWGVSDPQVSGWATTVPGTLSVSRVQKEARLEFTGPACEIRATFGWLRVERVSGYVAGA
jgi:hypothetical protein